MASDAVAAGDVAGHQPEEAKAKNDQDQVKHGTRLQAQEQGLLVSAIRIKAICEKTARFIKNL